MGMNDITGAVIASAIKVHRELGPGLLESAYEACLVHDLRNRGFTVLQQVELPIVFDGLAIDVGYRVDLIVNDTVIVELKAVLEMNPIFDAQIISYLKLSGKPVGLLINFHVEKLVDGVRRFKCG
jgi:GxxExxY protein